MYMCLCQSCSKNVYSHISGGKDDVSWTSTALIRSRYANTRVKGIAKSVWYNTHRHRQWLQENSIKACKWRAKRTACRTR